LFITYDQLEAEMIKDLLESGGIEVEIRSSKVSPYPVSVGKMGEVKLLVKAEDRDEAEQLLRERDSGADFEDPQGSESGPEAPPQAGRQ